MTLSGVLSGDRFYEAKGVVEELLEKLGIFGVDFKHDVRKTDLFAPGATAVVETGKNLLGRVGEIGPKVLEKFEIGKKVVFFDLDFETLVKLATDTKTYKPISTFPPIIEDLSFVIPQKTLVGELIKEIRKASRLIQKVVLIDSYKETRTFRITYQSQKKTLTDKEVKRVREKAVKRVNQKFKARIKA